jgi:hypothetical protein
MPAGKEGFIYVVADIVKRECADPFTRNIV